MPLYVDRKIDLNLAGDRMSGFESYPRTLSNSPITCTSGTLRLSFFTPTDSFTASKISIMTGSTAAAATPTVVRFGLYSVDSAGVGTLVASTPNDTTLLASINTIYTKDLSVAVTVNGGQRYALGFIIVTAAATPTIAGFGQYGDLTDDAPRLTGTLSGQTDLPASFTDTLTPLSGRYWMRAWA